MQGRMSLSPEREDARVDSERPAQRRRLRRPQDQKQQGQAQNETEGEGGAGPQSQVRSKAQKHWVPRCSPALRQIRCYNFSIVASAATCCVRHLLFCPQRLRSDFGAQEVPCKDWSVGNVEGDEGAATRHDSSRHNGISNGHSNNNQSNTAVGGPGDAAPPRGTGGGGKGPGIDVHNREGLDPQEPGHGHAADVEGGDEGDVDYDDLPPCESCPLCLHLLHAPVRTPCRHTFCCRCFTRWADVSLARGRLQMQRGGVVGRMHPDEDAARQPVPCPLCRTQVPRRLPVDEHRVSGNGGPDC